MKKVFQCLFIFLLLSTVSSAQFFNGYQMTFGKNRVQYDDKFWSFMRFKKFDTYFYVGGVELAAYTGRTADKDLAEIEKLFDYKLDGRIQFIIYNKLSEAKQSNIGLQTDELSNNIGGTTRIVGNKVFLYYNGDHDKLHEQIRAGIARVLIDQIMFGGDIKDRLQNSALLSLPDWYINGLVSYISRTWDAEIDNTVKDGVVSGRYLKFNHLSGNDAVYAGHSIWKYIVDTYTSSSISNLLYMTRINRNIESGLMYVLGLSVKDLAANWKEATKARYLNADYKLDSIPTLTIVKRPKVKLNYTQLKTSADGRYSSYVTNDLGRYKLYLYNHDKKKRKRILRGGYRSYAQETDLTFPIIAWHPTGQLIGVIRERRGKLWLGTYTLSNKKYEEGVLFNFEKVLDFSYSNDGQSIVLSGVQKGQTDIFVYNLRTRTFTQVTKDIFDDLNPHFINNSSAIVFASNRINDTLYVTDKNVLPESFHYDIFYYDYAGRSNVLRRITSTPEYDEIQPMQYDSANISYLSDENGIVNRYVAHLDSALSYVDTVEHYRMIVSNYPQTNYQRNVIQQDINQNLNRVSQIFYKNGRYCLTVERMSLALLSETPLPKTLFRNEADLNSEISTAEKTKPAVVKPALIDQSVPSRSDDVIMVTDSNAVDIDNYVFQSDFPKSKNKKEKKKEKLVEQFGVVTDSTVKPVDSTIVILPKQRNYETAFSSNYFVSQLDNTLLNQTYQLFTGGGAVFYNPGLNAFIKLGISDLMEDYRITGGFKLGFDLNSNEYYLSYENLKKRFDKQITFYRQALFLTQFGAKLHSHEMRFGGKWPFSDVSSIRGSVAYRNDRVVSLATDFNSLVFANQQRNWATCRVEYVFDNTLNVGLNIFNGTRLKVFGEYFKQVDRANSGLAIVGADIRHYQKIHRVLIWANRFAAGTSFGPEKLIYYMGGTDNWLAPTFNYETPIDYSQNYYFQTLATNLRGFNQNIRNGNTFAAINSELRFPVFRYLLNRPIKSDFVRNFQIVGFGDIGTAWNGASPYDSTNALNRKFYSLSPFNITIISQNDPIVGGFGFGLRTRLLGYFLRTDWAWGVQNRELQPRKFYFSLGVDF